MFIMISNESITHSSLRIISITQPLATRNSSHRGANFTPNVFFNFDISCVASGISIHNVPFNIVTDNCAIICPQVFGPYIHPMAQQKKRCATALRMPNHANNNDNLQCGSIFVLPMDASLHDIYNSLSMAIDNAIF